MMRILILLTKKKQIQRTVLCSDNDKKLSLVTKTKLQMKNPKTVLKFSFIALFIIIILSYALFQARNIILGPVIKIETPENGTSLDYSLVNIKGTAKNISLISMNDRQIFIDEHGEFSEKLLLSYGYNIITIKARDRFGRKTEKVLELVYK